MLSASRDFFNFHKNKHVTIGQKLVHVRENKAVKNLTFGYWCVPTIFNGAINKMN